MSLRNLRGYYSPAIAAVGAAKETILPHFCYTQVTSSFGDTAKINVLKSKYYGIKADPQNPQEWVIDYDNFTTLFLKHSNDENAPYYRHYFGSTLWRIADRAILGQAFNSMCFSNGVLDLPSTRKNYSYVVNNLPDYGILPFIEHYIITFGWGGPVDNTHYTAAEIDANFPNAQKLTATAANNNNIGYYFANHSFPIAKEYARLYTLQGGGASKTVKFNGRYAGIKGSIGAVDLSAVPGWLHLSNGTRFNPAWNDTIYLSELFGMTYWRNFVPSKWDENNDIDIYSVIVNNAPILWNTYLSYGGRSINTQADNIIAVTDWAKNRFNNYLWYQDKFDDNGETVYYRRCFAVGVLKYIIGNNQTFPDGSRDYLPQGPQSRFITED